MLDTRGWHSSSGDIITYIFSKIWVNQKKHVHHPGKNPTWFFLKGFFPIKPSTKSNPLPLPGPRGPPTQDPLRPRFRLFYRHGMWSLKYPTSFGFEANQPKTHKHTQHTQCHNTKIHNSSQLSCTNDHFNHFVQLCWSDVWMQSELNDSSCDRLRPPSCRLVTKLPAQASEGGICILHHLDEWEKEVAKLEICELMEESVLYTWDANSRTIERLV